jgi:hypothetical protein
MQRILLGFIILMVFYLSPEELESIFARTNNPM